MIVNRDFIKEYMTKNKLKYLSVFKDIDDDKLACLLCLTPSGTLNYYDATLVKKNDAFTGYLTNLNPLTNKRERVKF